MEQFVLLSKSAKGAAAAELVKQALETPGLYVFSELLDMPSIKEVHIFHNLHKLSQYIRRKFVKCYL